MPADKSDGMLPGGNRLAWTALVNQLQYSRVEGGLRLPFLS